MTLFVVMTLAAVLVTFAPRMDGADRLTLFITSPALLFLVWCFKDVFRDFGLVKHQDAVNRTWEKPEKCGLPEDSSAEPAEVPRKRKTRRRIGWWNPRGGYRGWQ